MLHLTSLQLPVAGLDVLHHCLALLQLLQLDPVLLVLVQVRPFPHHPVSALKDLLEAASADLPVFDEAGAAVVAVKVVAVVYGPAIVDAIGERMVGAAADKQPSLEGLGAQQQLILYRLPRVAVEALEACLAVRGAPDRGQFVSVVEKDLFGQLSPVVQRVLLDGVQVRRVLGYCGEEERGQGAGDDFVDVLELRLLVVQLLDADLVHLIVFDEEDAVCNAVNCAQTQGRVVGLQDDLAREVRKHAPHKLRDLREQLFQQREHVSAHSRTGSTGQALQLHKAVHVVLLLHYLLQQFFEVLSDAGPVHVTPVGPVIAAAFLLDEAELRAVAPAALFSEALVDHLRLHVHEHGLGNGLLVEELREESLVRGRGLAGFFVHAVEEGLSDLVAALSDLDEGHCHMQQVAGANPAYYTIIPLIQLKMGKLQYLILLLALLLTARTDNLNTDGPFEALAAQPAATASSTATSQPPTALQNSPPLIAAPKTESSLAQQKSTQPGAQPIGSSQQSASTQEGSLASPKILMNEVNKPIIAKGYKIDNGVSYQRVQVRELQKKYLFFNFKLAEKDKWQEVNITISNEGESKVLNKCTYSGVDSCYLPAFTMKADSVLFVHVQCQDDCTYSLNTQWSDTEHLLPGEEVVFMFGKDTTQIYHVELDNYDFQEVRIHLAPRVTRKPFDNVKIYGKFGKDAAPTPQEHDFVSINLWEDGEGVFLKKDQLKDKKLVLLIVGQAETTYRLVMELVTESQHEIENGEHIYEYLQARAEKVYHISLQSDVFEEYSLRFSTLSGGDLDIGYFTDKALSKAFTLQPLEYMRDSEYIINSRSANESKEGIYIRVRTKERDATYTIKYIGRNGADSIELNEHVYGFIPFYQAKFAHFDFRRWASETDNAQSLKFTVYLINILGKVRTEFFVCLTTLGLCTNPKLYRNATVPITAKPHDKVSEKHVYELVVEDRLLKKINAAEEEATIIIKFTDLELEANASQKAGFNLVAVQLVNNNKVAYLREGRPLEEKLGEKELKLYKYINSDPNVQEIRIHVNEIAGHVTFNGVISGEDRTANIQVVPEGNTLRFTSNLTQPIYASVLAESKAIFGISMQVIHKSEASGVSVVAISEDLTYTVKIQPSSYAIYEVTPIFYDFSFSYSSSQSVIVCAINPATNSCIDPTGTKLINPNLSVKGEIDNATLTDRKARIKITNPFSDSIAEVSFIFHSRKLNHCEDKAIGKVYNEVVHDYTCFSYLLQEEEKTLELYISKREFANLTYNVMLCGNHVPQLSLAKIVEVGPELLAEHCKNSHANRKLAIVWSVSTQLLNREEKSVKVDVLAQYRGELILLSEGVSYNKLARVTEGPIAKFAYNLINKKDTKILVSQLRGRFKVFAKLVSEPTKEQETVSNINYHQVSSQTLDYSQQPIILITEEDIRKANCIDCAILVAVYSEADIGSEVEFDIQIVQRYYSLSDDTAVEGYLEAGSFAYYSYVAREEENSTILVILSDHNRQCANMYLSLLENPGPSSHIAKSSGANELIFRHAAGEKKYFLSVEATKVCDYSISVLSVDSSIHSLKRGKQNMIRFPEGVVKYFFLEHYTAEPFKIVTLTKYGEIRMYLNQSSINVNKKSFTTAEIALEKFTYKSQHSNTLAVDSKHPLFCQKCSYFLAIEALKNTEATLYLVYPQTTVTLTEGHFLSDYLASKGDYTLATYNRIEKTQLSLKVHSGSVSIMAAYKQTTLQQKFEASPNIQTLTLDMRAQPAPAQKTIPEADPNLGQPSAEPAVAAVERIPINIVITATSDEASYTLEMLSLASNSQIGQIATYQSLIAGQPNKLKVGTSKAVCLEGYLRTANEELILSADNENKELFPQLIMQASINGEKAEIGQTFTKNIMGITLANNATRVAQKANKFQLCLKLLAQEQPKKADSEEVKEVGTEEEEEPSFIAYITQVNTVNILPSDTDSVVKGESTFVIHSEGEFLLDVFECSGEAKVNYGDSLETLEKSKLKMLDSVNMPSQRHAIKISQKQTTFVKIKSSHAIVKWLPIDYEFQRGVGYMKFESGDLRYSSKFKEIAVEYQPLQLSKQLKATVKEVEYLLYISNSSTSIEYASQCESPAFDVIVMPLPAPKLSQTEYSVRAIEKEELQKVYSGSENIYFNVVAKLSLVVPASEAASKFGSSDEHEHYRFIYNRQQIPLASYQQNQIESIPYHYLIVLLLSIAVVLILFTYLFTRKIVPLLARLKSSNLVEEEPAQEHRDDLEVPASSDRNQRAPDVAVETEERMGK